MAIRIHTTRPMAANEPAADRLAALYPDWDERLVTIVAVSLAVLVVALIAVVMGMA
jgi:hypothetical protein